MKISAVLLCWMAIVVAPLLSQAAAKTVQTRAHVFNTRPFLWVEAENFHTRGADPTNNGWKIVSKENPITSTQGLAILPADSNVSATALLDDIGGTSHEDTALYQVQFVTPGTYQLYTRHSMYDSNGNNNYGNEDSIFMSPAFNMNSAGDWVGFTGLEFDENDVTVDIPIPGYAHDQDGFKPSTGNSQNDGWLALRDWGIKSLGIVNHSNTAVSSDWNGHFNWYNRPTFVSAGPAGGFDSEFGFKTEYTVTPAMVGQTLTFEIGARENYCVIDGFLFIQTNNIYPFNDLLDIYSQADLDEIIVLGTPEIPEPTSLVLFVIGIAAYQTTRRRENGLV